MKTLIHRLADWARERPDDVAQRYKRDGQWHDITACQYLERVVHLGLFLEGHGFGAGDVAAIMAYNSPEWVHADLSPHLLGGMSVGVYPNASERDIDHILELTKAPVVFVGNRADYDTLAGGTGSVPDWVKTIVTFTGGTDGIPRAVSYDEAILEGKRLAAGRDIEAYLEKMDPDDGAFLIFTSGTTGRPKGAILSHRNVASTSDLVIKHWSMPYGNQRMFSFLPLCHVAERLQNIGAGLTNRYTIWFCTAFEHVKSELVEASPTIFLAVPRVWDKFMEGVLEKLGRATGARARLARWALATGRGFAEKRYRVHGRGPGVADLVKFKVADALALRKIRRALGMDDLVIAASGAAPLSAHVNWWFRSLGIDIQEAFGQTESTGIICLTPIGQDAAGTVGVPAPGTEFRIAEDGEILSRGSHIFKGYLKNDKATRETIDRDGWLHTGDLGELTDAGFVRIRGRKKEILKTSGGKMTAPVPIEERIKEGEGISQVCMVGDGRKFFSALVTLSETKINELRRAGMLKDGGTVDDEEIVRGVQREVDRVNATLAGYERIKKFRVIDREFSIDEGEMTPTLKMKRKTIEERFKSLIDEMYDE